MPATDPERELRPATLDDAAIVADLESRRDPMDPRDPILLRYWWQMEDELERPMRLVLVHDGIAVAFVGATHDRWMDGEKRFGLVRPRLSDETWSEDRYAELAELGQQWLRSEGAETAVARVREDFPRELDVLGRLGFRENRRMPTFELDLVARRNHVLEEAAKTKDRLAQEGVLLRPLSEESDPDRFQKLHVTMVESSRDVPRSVPKHDLSFDAWQRFWFGNPAIREDRFWVAREGDDIVACSVLDSPVVHGVPSTAYTGTLRRVRGRGIARALKYQSMAQAIAVGYTRVRTSNDADNPPILRINAEMGYRVVAPVIELHHPL
ncbi:MAG TPA: GNAT family N-acetyltransferase [Candidatus Dormibacteraeota bacterium]|nr:GNAT family N-acetyltransferase [Candidatus Dormibacteraeota bacterium]